MTNIINEESPDDSNNEEITIDNWKPSEKKKTLIPPEWRKRQIRDNFNQKPGIDEVTKIRFYLKKGYADHEIMNAFGINAETILAIKNKRYSVIEGIQLNDLDKIQKKFKLLDDEILKIKNNFNYILNKLAINDQDIKEFYEQKKDEPLKQSGEKQKNKTLKKKIKDKA